MHDPVGYRITPPVATLNIHPIANAVSEWDANDCKFKFHLKLLTNSASPHLREMLSPLNCRFWLTRVIAKNGFVELTTEDAETPVWAARNEANEIVRLARPGHNSPSTI